MDALRSHPPPPDYIRDSGSPCSGMRTERLPRWMVLSWNFLPASQLFTCAHVFTGRNSRVVKRQRPPLRREKRPPPTGVHKVKPMSVRILGGTIKERYLSQRFLLIYSWGWVVERKTREFFFTSEPLCEEKNKKGGKYREQLYLLSWKREEFHWTRLQPM